MDTARNVLDRLVPKIPRPRTVKLPGVTDAQRAALDAERNVLKRNRLGILSALYQKSPAPYEGTVPGHVKAKRRARGKVAKASRKLNRGR